MHERQPRSRTDRRLAAGARPLRALAARIAVLRRRSRRLGRAGDRGEPRLRHGACAEGLSLSALPPSARRARSRPNAHAAAAPAGGTARERAHVAALGALAGRTLARGERAARGHRHRISARCAGPADRPPGRFLHRRCAHAARPHRACAAVLVGCHARLPRHARHARVRAGGDRRLRPRRSGSAAAPSRSSRATAGRSTRWRMSWKCRAGSRTASPGCAPIRRRGPRRASSRSTIGGTWRCSISISARSTRC